MNRYLTTKRTKDTKSERIEGIQSIRLLRDLRVFVVESSVVHGSNARAATR
ncbi:MAG: hypothetical protein AB7O66_06155 [Limisphaerales bacterium]